MQLGESQPNWIVECLKPSFTFLFFCYELFDLHCLLSSHMAGCWANSVDQNFLLIFHSWNVGGTLDNNNHRKRGFASPYTATSKFSIYVQNGIMFHWLNTFHYSSFAFTSAFVNAVWSIYLGKFYFCFQWLIQVFHAALVSYQINKNFLKDIEAISFSSSTVEAKRVAATSFFHDKPFAENIVMIVTKSFIHVNHT